MKEMKGWKKVTFRTLRMRSADRGANQESRWGARACFMVVSSGRLLREKDGSWSRGASYVARAKVEAK